MDQASQNQNLTSPQAKKKILIVDDEALIAQAFSSFLKVGGYESYQANNTAEAKVILAQNSIDLVISDIRMPGEDGLSFLDFLSSKYPDTLVIMMTGNLDSVVTYEAYARGVVEFMVKPIPPTDLIARVQELFEQQSSSVHAHEHSEIDNLLQELEPQKSKSLENLDEVDDLLDDLINSTKAL